MKNEAKRISVIRVSYKVLCNILLSNLNPTPYESLIGLIDQRVSTLFLKTQPKLIGFEHTNTLFL